MAKKQPICPKCPSGLLHIEDGTYFCVECDMSFTAEEVAQFEEMRNKKQPFTLMIAVYKLGSALAVLGGYMGIASLFVWTIPDFIKTEKYEIYSRTIMGWAIPFLVLGMIINSIPLFTSSGRERVRTIILQVFKIVICLAAIIVIIIVLNKKFG